MRHVLWVAAGIVVLASAGQAKADLITYDLIYSQLGTSDSTGTGTITIDTSLVNSTGVTYQDVSHFVTDFSLTVHSLGPRDVYAGSWDFAGYNGSTDHFDLGGPRDHVSGGFVLDVGRTPVDFSQELRAQGVLLSLFPNETEANTPYSSSGFKIAQTPPSGIFEDTRELFFHSMTPELRAVPEPSTMTLTALGMGCCALVAYRRRRAP